VVKRGLVVAVGGAAIVIAGLSGCSSDEKKSESPATTTAGATTGGGTASATAAPSGGTKVSIDGQDQNVSGTVVCSAMGGNMNIAIGDAATGIAAVVSEDGSNVQSVGLGNVNGVTLGYQNGTGQGEAKAEKSDNTWKISGTATGIDIANPMQPVNKPFEIEVTCP
jgi:lipoprotein LpqH